MRDQFEAALKENPLEPANHYAYADWLEDNDFPEEARVQREWTPEKHRAALSFMSDYLTTLNDYTELNYHRAEYDDDYASEWGSPRSITLDGLLEVATNRLQDNWARETHIIIYGVDTPDIFHQLKEEFWEHFTVLTGIPTAGKSPGGVVGCSY